MNGVFFAASAASGTQAYHASVEASNAAHQASRARDEVDLLRADVEKLLMISEALWSMLEEQHGYTEDELVRRVEQIDLRDGRLDGKVAKGPAERCPGCHRAILGRRPVCLYCGHTVKRGPFER